MDREVCLNSDIIIELLKNNNEVKKEIDSIEAIFYTTPINIFEVWYGKKKHEGIKEFIEKIKVINISKEIGIKTAEIMDKLREEGQLIEFRDIMIASICIENNLELLTNNKKHFERLRKFGLKLI